MKETNYLYPFLNFVNECHTFNTLGTLKETSYSNDEVNFSLRCFCNDKTIIRLSYIINRNHNETLNLIIYHNESFSKIARNRQIKILKALQKYFFKKKSTTQNVENVEDRYLKLVESGDIILATLKDTWKHIRIELNQELDFYSIIEYLLKECK